MNRTRIKQRVFLVGLVLGLVVSLGFLMSLSQIISSFQEGADPAAIFRGNELIVPDAAQVIWDEDSLASEHAPTVSEREEVIVGYWNAWQALNRAYELGDTSDLSTYFALPALTPIHDAVIETSPHIFSTSGHQLMLRFFSQDNSIISFEDHFLTQETIFGEQQNIPSHAEVTMSNDNGRWRIRLLTLNYEAPNT